MELGALVSTIVYVWLIPGLFALIFVTFLWGTLTYYISGGPDEEMREKGKSVIMYSLIAFFVLSVIYAVAKMAESVFS